MSDIGPGSACMYCGAVTDSEHSSECPTLRQMCFGYPRSSKWDEFVAAHKKVQPYCLVCGYQVVGFSVPQQLQVHHMYPFHIVVALGRPDLELDERNCYTMCAGHHIGIGHLQYWESYNPNLLQHCSLFRGLTPLQIKASHVWQDAVTMRPIPFSDMSQSFKTALKHDLDKLMPPRAA